MNNFKKLLASAMALTMVTSVLPAAAATEVNAATCTELSNLARFESILERNESSYETMNSDLEARFDGVNTQNVFDYIIANGTDEQTRTEWSAAESKGTVEYKVANNPFAQTGFYQNNNFIDSEERLISNLEPAEDYKLVVKDGEYVAEITAEDLVKEIKENVNTAVEYGYVQNLVVVERNGFFWDIANGEADAGCYYSLDQIVNARYAIAVANDMRDAFGSDYTGYERGYVYNVAKDLNKDNIAESKLEDHREYLEGLVADYSTNMTEEQTEMVDGLLDEIYDRLGINPGDDKYEEALSKFVEDLLEDGYDGDKDGEIDIVSLEDFLEKETITKTDVNKQIKAIKSTKEYRSFDEEEDVIAVIEEYEAMIESIDEVADALNTRLNESYNNYITGGSKSVRSAVKALLTDSKVDAEDRVNNLIYNITVDQYNVLKAFKEDVVDVVWTMEAKEYANRFVDNSSKSVFATLTQLNSVLRDFMATDNSDAALLTFDSTDGTWAWDDLTAHMEEVITSLDLIENELSKLEAVTLTANDRDLLNSIDDAVFYLKEYSKDNLTSAQTRELRNAERKIDELLEAYRVKFGTVGTTTGWVDMGNGNWKYYEADGTAPTKWICSAPNTWYYVQNGVMMRNYWVWRDANSAYYVGDDGVMVYGPTTVNGYALDANGLWHR